MDNSEANLSRTESQKSKDGQRKPILSRLTNLITCGYSSIRHSLSFHPIRAESTQSESELHSFLRCDDLFSFSDVCVPMSPEIYSAISAGKQTCLQQMMGNYNMKCLKTNLGESVLHLAAASGHVELVKNIVDKCPCLLLDPDSRDQLPLHVAAHAGHVDVVKALVAIITFVADRCLTEDKKRLDIYVREDKSGDTPLHLALRAVHTKTAACLVNENKQASFLPNKDGITPLYMAVEAGILSLVKEMLKRTENCGQDLELKGKKSLVHAAMKARNTDVLQEVLNKFPYLKDERDDEGNTCLSIGASIGFYRGVRMLLKQSPETVFASNDDGSYPIHIAAEKGHTYVLKVILIFCPESAYLLNQHGQNILHISSKNGRFSFFLFSFLWAFSSMNQLIVKQDVDGNTPPHLATINWHPRTLFYLLNNHNGNCMYIQNNKGQTPLDIAESNMKPDYIYMERMTQMVLNINTDPKRRYPEKKKVMRRSNALAGDSKEQYVNTLLVVAALVATVTFAAGFTIPGGFNSSGPKSGSATLANDFRLVCFMVFDTLAMLFSILTIVTLIWGHLGGPALVPKSLDAALPYLFYALLFMVMGFYCGVYIAFVHVKGLLIFLIVTSVIFVPLILIVLGPHVILHVPGIAPLFGMSLKLSLKLFGHTYLWAFRKIIENDRSGFLRKFFHWFDVPFWVYIREYIRKYIPIVPTRNLTEESENTRGEHRESRF